MRRIAVIGVSGSGKSFVCARLSELLGLPIIGLDSYFHQANWTPSPDAEFEAAVMSRVADAEASPGGWIVDGNYNSRVGDALQERADAIVWVDPPRLRVMLQIVPRTLRRVVTRQELWNGNREPWTNLYRWDPEKNIIRWAWTQWPVYREEYGEKLASGGWGDATVYRLRTRESVREFLAGVERR